jgi:two-component system response regulator AtoC
MSDNWGVRQAVLTGDGPALGVGGLPPEDVVFGQSVAMQAVRHRVEKVANADVPLLIQGDNGTGKEVLARVVHARSRWSSGPFVKVNCAALPGTLIESELFGYERGAFTGADTSKPGRVEMAQGGTLFLDEIGEIDLGLQAKLLQFLQDGQFCRIGGHEDRGVQTRIICATGHRLEEEVQSGRFRADLFYRINVIHITLPPLCDRRADIPFLMNYFLAVSSSRFQKPVPSLSGGITRALQRCDWPGNIRELENCMMRLVILGTEEALEAYLPKRQPQAVSFAGTENGPVSLKHIAEMAQRELERDVILKTLEKYNWNRRKAAEALKISYRTLLYKVQEAGLRSIRRRTGSCLQSDSACTGPASADQPSPALQSRDSFDHSTTGLHSKTKTFSED